MKKISQISKIFFAALLAVIIFAQSGLVSMASNRTISFSGYTWNVKNSYFGPGPNWWTDAASDVYTDNNGALHLSIINRGGTWYSSEVYLPNSLGYGTYTFTTNSNVDSFDPNVVLGLFMYQDDTHEIDTEYSRWGIEGGPNLGHSVQPAGTKGNNYQYKVALDHTLPVTNEIDWQPSGVVFRTTQNGNLIKEWSYSGADNFVPGKEFADINFWLMKGLAPINGQNVEAVISSFQFTPYLVPAVTITAPAPAPAPAPATTITPVKESIIVETVITAPTAPTVTVEPRHSSPSKNISRLFVRKKMEFTRKIHKINYLKKGVRIR